MKKTREERRAFLDRLEKKYKEKLLLLDYKKESELLSQQLRAMRGVSVDKLNADDAELLDLPDFKLSAS